VDDARQIRVSNQRIWFFCANRRANRNSAGMQIRIGIVFAIGYSRIPKLDVAGSNPVARF
jgi:hypothetical protein